MKKAIAVLISDLHFSINTLPLASTALKAALENAKDRKVPLIIAGDLHDTKANIRGECIKAMLDIFETAEQRIYVTIGNHDRINEKSEPHSLEFLRQQVHIIDRPYYAKSLNCHLVPYQHDIEKMKDTLDLIRRGYPAQRRLIMHQGVQGASMGDYVIDKSSLPAEAFQDLKVISGHYHRHQTVGSVTYIGTPYTITFAEANDGPKGYQILYDDFTMNQVPLDLRRHVIIERTVETLYNKVFESTNKFDIVWLKVTGAQSELAKIKKTELGAKLFGHSNFKLDLIPTPSAKTDSPLIKSTEPEILDELINQMIEIPAQKEYLKTLWRKLL